ncbi:hypothetical protein [Cellulosimicrobium sp. CUA-896]|uniref:hypothetical protein n=1 Tax=Cellulosimicrobium sp. CUA-896 TaxID=1517881 RepID=UPI0009613126|nr:hypothetical protein [Cellulosimicrobium sp. CUA-896]OLT50906.1 hypothetical protein BJF88_01940 [Cellulosimicrobium sp. CUA-896]
MKSKLALVVGIGVGYVLGTRAGRERFEEIRGKAKELWQSDDVQSAVHSAQDKVTTVAKEQGAKVAGVAKEQGGKVADAVRSQTSGSSEPGKHSNGAASPDPTSRDDYRI